VGRFEGELGFGSERLFGFFEFLLEGFDGLKGGIWSASYWWRGWMQAMVIECSIPYLSIGSLIVGRQVVGSILDFGGESRDASETVIGGVWTLAADEGSISKAVHLLLQGCEGDQLVLGGSGSLFVEQHTCDLLLEIVEEALLAGQLGHDCGEEWDTRNNGMWDDLV
jgi:hypothetical protein